MRNLHWLHGPETPFTEWQKFLGDTAVEMTGVQPKKEDHCRVDSCHVSEGFMWWLDSHTIKWFFLIAGVYFHKWWLDSHEITKPCLSQWWLDSHNGR